MKALKLITVLIGLFAIVACSSAPKRVGVEMGINPLTGGVCAEPYYLAVTSKDSTDRSGTLHITACKVGEYENGDMRLIAMSVKETIGGTTVGRATEGIFAGSAGAFMTAVAINESAKSRAMRCNSTAETCLIGSTINSPTGGHAITNTSVEAMSEMIGGHPLPKLSGN